MWKEDPITRELISTASGDVDWGPSGTGDPTAEYFGAVKTRSRLLTDHLPPTKDQRLASGNGRWDGQGDLKKKKKYAQNHI